MLNIGRMGPGSQRYYLEHVAGPDDGVQVDYYLQRGEAPGRWLGRGPGGVGLSGQVMPEQLGRILDGDHPGTGDRLAAHPARKLPGLDLTFRAPKSVSLLWALTDDPDVAAAVQDAHDTAVTEAVGYLERHAVRSRRGAGGVESVEVDGLIAATFRHRTSRAEDPLLHTHVLAANLARTSDDRVWRTLDSRRLFAHAKTAGTVYQAALRHQLVVRLRVSWGPVTNGTADLEGVDRLWIDGFSKRRSAIVREMARRGETSAAAAQVATLATRDVKPVQPTELELRQGWADEARRLGIPSGWTRRVVGRHQPETPDLDSLAQRLFGPEGVTEHASTFRPRDLVQQIAAALPDGAPVETIEALAEHVLARGVEVGEVVALGPETERPVVEVGGRADAEGGRFTTRGLLLTEQAAIHTALHRQREGAAVARPAAVAGAIGRRPTLSGEQADMIRRLTSDGDGVVVVVGKAGTGKTYALDAAREAWEHSGLRVTGVALAARAALELEESAGIPSSTLARLLGQLDDPTSIGSPLLPGQVLVVDEAGMIGTRQLGRLLDHTSRLNVKTVLVGDPRQLPEIDAGGLYLALSRRLPTVELADNRRQDSRWERAVLDDLRTGDIHAAVAAITGHKAQGLTVDHTFVLGSDALYRQWGYVAMSRGRETNRLYLHAVPDMRPEAHQRPKPADPIATVTRQLQRDTTATPVSDEAARAIADAQRRLEQARQWLAQPQVRTAIDLHDRHDRDMRRYETLGAEHDRLTARYDQRGIGLTRTTRAQRRDLHDRLVHLTEQLHQLHDRILATRTQLADLPAPADIDRVRGQQRRAQATLDQLTRPPTPERTQLPFRSLGITRGRAR